MPRTTTRGASAPTDVHALVAQLPDVEIKRYLDGIRELIDTKPASPRGQRRRKKSTYRLRVDLLDVKPPIWRRLLVPSDISLPTLHRVLQTAMGWNGGRMHQFAKGTNRSDPHAERYVADPSFVAPGAVFEGEVRLDELLAAKGDRLFYEYDLGGGWLHQIRLEAIEPALEGEPKYRCVAGRRACPPESCGSLDTYRELLALTTLPADELQIEQLGRLRCHTPAGWSPDLFDPKQADEALRDAASAA